MGPNVSSLKQLYSFPETINGLPQQKKVVQNLDLHFRKISNEMTHDIFVTKAAKSNECKNQLGGLFSSAILSQKILIDGIISFI